VADRSDYFKDYYKENEDKIKEQRKQYRQKKRGELTAKSTAWQKENPEKAAEIRKRHYEKNEPKRIAAAIHKQLDKYAAKNPTATMTAVRAWLDNK